MSSCRGGAEAATYGRTGQLLTVTSLISVSITLIYKFLLYNELLLHNEFLLYNELLRRLDGRTHMESAAAVIGDIPDGSQSEGSGRTVSAGIMAANSHVAAAARL
jgi:hypothetical protein